MMYWLLKFNNKNYKILNQLDKFLQLVFNLENKLFCKNFFSWYIKFSIWQFYYFGLLFDEIFSKTIRYFYVKILALPGYFFIDRWFSNWIGMKFFQNFLVIFSNFFYFEKLDYFFYFIMILNVFFFFLLYLFLIFFFFI